MMRCKWAEADDLMRAYHDAEWGKPLKESRALWECLMLEGFQAGLSWHVILKKREAFRAAFDGFDPLKVAEYGPEKIEALMADPGIVRARAKILATIEGARIYNRMQASGEDFADFIWGFTDGAVVRGDGISPVSPLSERLSKELKRRGFKFVGPTIAHAYLQAVGVLDDHAPDCDFR